MRGSTFSAAVTFVVFACLLSVINDGAPPFALALPLPEPNPGIGSVTGSRPGFIGRFLGRLGGRGPKRPVAGPLPPRVSQLTSEQMRRVQEQLANPQRRPSSGK
uniref:Secreted protein n=1 Tax=Rhipicephalus appendiculatus TaxID=34631 RepID=A0A131YR74_RHIAP